MGNILTVNPKYKPDAAIIHSQRIAAAGLSSFCTFIIISLENKLLAKTLEERNSNTLTTRRTAHI